MAKPKEPIYVWAAADVNLPSTGRPNKSKPIDDLLAKGYDKGQKPAAEEFNYILNMSSAWVAWIVNEKFPELEAEIARLLAELEARINQQLDVIRQDIAKVKQDLADLKRYVDQQVASLKQEIQGVRNDLNKLRQDFDAAIAQVNGRIDDLEPRLVPIGAVIPWPGATPPNGWLECNGQVFNTGTNPKLYAVLGRNTVPDYRGLFLRGWAHGSGANDPEAGRALGSVQGDTLQNITGEFIADIAQIGLAGRSDLVNGAFADEGGVAGGDAGIVNHREVRKYSLNASRVARTSTETRPKNVAVMYIIKTDQAQSSGGNSPTAIVVSPDTITNRVGYTVKATASVLPASIAGQYPVSWSTQNGSVATVDGSGNIRLVGPGETNIIASLSTGMNVAIRVTSYSVLTSISIADPGQIQVTESKMLVVTKNPGGANEPLQFLSNNSGVATVNDAGYVTGVSPGSATITVRGTLSGVSSTRSVTIIPEQVEESVQDNRLGAVGSYIPPGNEISWTFQAPQGCALTGILVQDTGSNSGDNIGGVYYKPIQKKVNGVWVTITG